MSPEKGLPINRKFTLASSALGVIFFTCFGKDSQGSFQQTQATLINHPSHIVAQSLERSIDKIDGAMISLEYRGHNVFRPSYPGVGILFSKRLILPPHPPDPKTARSIVREMKISLAGQEQITGQLDHLHQAILNKENNRNLVINEATFVEERMGLTSVGDSMAKMRDSYLSDLSQLTSELNRFRYRYQFSWFGIWVSLMPGIYSFMRSFKTMRGE